MAKNNKKSGNILWKGVKFAAGGVFKMAKPVLDLGAKAVGTAGKLTVGAVKLAAKGALAAGAFSVASDIYKDFDPFNSEHKIRLESANMSNVSVPEIPVSDNTSSNDLELY